jgi:glycosyltransferase involved in cell wall biosynthesis
MTLPLTIIHVQTRFVRAGAEENTWVSCVHQAQLGHKVIILCGPESNIEYYDSMGTNVSLQIVPSLVREISPKLDYRCFKELRALFKTLKPDVVHTHTSKAGILGRLAAASTGVPNIIHGVHMLPFSNIGLVEKLVYVSAEHAVAPMTQHFVHVSHGTRSAYRNAFIGLRTPHSVVRSGMDVATFDAAPWPDDWQSLLGVAPGEDKPQVILMLSSLEVRKRHREFLDGFARVTKSGEPIRLLLGGEGPERGNLEAQIARLGLGDRVKLAGHRSDPERLVALSDIGTLASLREGLPRVVVQYLAGGKPAVVSPLHGIEEIVQSGVNGFVLPNKDAASIAETAVKVLRDKDLLESLSQGARNTNVAEWSKASMLDQLDDVYAKALGSSYDRTPAFEPLPYEVKARA